MRMQMIYIMTLAQQAANEYIQETVDRLVKIFNENNDEEDEESLDKVAKA